MRSVGSTDESVHERLMVRLKELVKGCANCGSGVSWLWRKVPHWEVLELEDGLVKNISLQVQPDLKPASTIPIVVLRLETAQSPRAFSHSC